MGFLTGKKDSEWHIISELCKLSLLYLKVILIVVDSMLSIILTILQTGMPIFGSCSSSTEGESPESIEP